MIMLMLNIFKLKEQEIIWKYYASRKQVCLIHMCK